MSTSRPAIQKDSKPGLQVLSEPDSISERLQELLVHCKYMDLGDAAGFLSDLSALLLEVTEHQQHQRRQGPEQE